VTAQPFTARDDHFHFDAMSDRWWETETCWFAFHNVERRLGGWLYVMARPNIGTVAGGAWVWDASASLPWEVLYSANYTAMRLPRDQDLTDIRLPTGVSVRAIEPLKSYALRYEDGGAIAMDLRFDAVMPPHALTSVASGFGSLSHFDQLGRVHGTLTLRGERIAIDSLSMRDRSWGPRPEHRPRPSAYVTGAATPEHGFLAVANPAEGGVVTHGFLLRGGRVENLKGAVRRTERHPDTGQVAKITIEGVDAAGRRFRADGAPLNRIVINRHTFIDNNSLIEWTMDNGETAWGEDQDCWPVANWRDHMKSVRTAASAPDPG
jgi:hypothetical protein